jgi:predicted Zn-ribbon and HTH transcriptional regulator
VIEVLHRAANTDPRFRTKSCHKLLEGFRDATGKAVTSAAGVDQLARLVTALRERPAEGAGQPTVAGTPPAGGATPQGLLMTPQAESQVLTDPVPCVQCGYELRGLPATARCPECQHPIDHSLNPDRLIFADPAWLGRINRGLWMMMGAGALFAAWVMLMAPFWQLPGGPELGAALWTALATIVVTIATAAAYRIAATAERSASRQPFRPFGFGWLLPVAAIPVAAGGIILGLSLAHSTRMRLELAMELVCVWGVLLVVGGFGLNLAWWVWKLLQRATRSRWRWLDHGVLLGLFTIVGVLTIGALRITLRVKMGELNSTIMAPPMLLGLIALWLGGATVATATGFALRIAWARRLCVRLDLGAWTTGAAPKVGGSDTYYQSLSTLAGKRRIAGVDATPPVPMPPSRPVSGAPQAAQASALQQPGTPLAAPVPCVSCGHQLSGLTANAKCPECGMSVQASLHPARLIFADPESLGRIARHIDRTGVALLVGLLLLLVTLPFQAWVHGASGLISLIYAPVWIAVVVVAVHACCRAAARMRLPEADRASEPWRWTVWSAASVTIAALIGYGLWLWQSGALVADEARPALRFWPCLVLLVPLGVVPPLLAAFAASLRQGGDERRAGTLASFAAILPFGLVGVLFLMVALVSSPAAAPNLGVLIGLMIVSLPGAFFGLRVASAALKQAREGHVDYQAATGVSGKQVAPPSGGGPS